MSTGYSWEGISRYERRCLVRAMYLIATVVAMSTWGAISSARPFYLAIQYTHWPCCTQHSNGDNS